MHSTPTHLRMLLNGSTPNRSPIVGSLAFSLRSATFVCLRFHRLSHKGARSKREFHQEIQAELYNPCLIRKGTHWHWLILGRSCEIKAEPFAAHTLFVICKVEYSSTIRLFNVSLAPNSAGGKIRCSQLGYLEGSMIPHLFLFCCFNSG